MSATFNMLFIRKFADGRREFTAVSDHKPRDRQARYSYTAGPSWWFTPRSSDLSDSEWAQIRQLFETTQGDWSHRHPDYRSWSFIRRWDKSWILGPF